MKQNILLLSILTSVFMHLLLASGLDYWSALAPLQKSKSFEIEYIPKMSEHTELKKKNDDQDSSKNKTLAKQIVEQEKQINNLKDQNAKYLSLFNQKVIPETKSKNNGDFKNQKKSATLRNSANKVALGRSGQTLPKLQQLLPTVDWKEWRKQKTETSSSLNQIDQSSQASQTNDHLKDVKIGANTALSTKEFVYYSYYNRIRGQLRQHWEPTIKDKVFKILKSGRTISSSRDHITRIIITLNSAGSLLKIQLLEESGVRDLDEAAIEAFKAAAPFPNPPKGIVEKDGTIHIRWDFVLES